MWNYMFNENFLQGTIKEKLHWLIIGRRGLEKTLVLDQYYTQLDPTKSDDDFASSRSSGSLSVWRASVRWPSFP